jgi:pimeloyl-ACP methyl ester carboxylesterase
MEHVTMATYVLIPGAGSTPWYWHRVEPELRRRGHEVVAVDLPCDDDSAGFPEYADVVIDAIGDRTEVVLVAQSLGAFTAPLVADRVPVELIVLVAPMVPAPGESGGDWWSNTGQSEAMRAYAEAEGRDPDATDAATIFVHDLPRDLVAESLQEVRDQSGTPFEAPWPLAAWPDVPTQVLITRHDRLFPAAFQRRVVRERLGIVPDEIDGGHLPALSRPQELADRLDAYAKAR